MQVRPEVYQQLYKAHRAKEQQVRYLQEQLDNVRAILQRAQSRIQKLEQELQR